MREALELSLLGYVYHRQGGIHLGMAPDRIHLESVHRSFENAQSTTWTFEAATPRTIPSNQAEVGGSPRLN